ncbi:cell division protein FtsL [Catenulispora subtropica]|uniref:Septum formation initiator n=1 Tax=Catenulispora subtropica TaxID=450798 RepID=A0ABN2QJM3_9ACTN
MTESGERGKAVSPRLVVLAGRKGKPSLLPFVAVLLVLGLLGMLALLFLNTELNKGAFTIKQQKATATKLTQEAQQISQSLAQLNGAGALASQASDLGMVPNGNPAFLAPNGSVLGSPSAAAVPTPTPTAPVTQATTPPPPEPTHPSATGSSR